MARPLNLFPKPPRLYAVSVDGYGEVHDTAPSAGNTPARANRDFCAAITGKTCHGFLVMSRARRAERLPSEGGAA